jgi:type I restriction enzyme M protein
LHAKASRVYHNVRQGKLSPQDAARLVYVLTMISKLIEAAKQEPEEDRSTAALLLEIREVGTMKAQEDGTETTEAIQKEHEVKGYAGRFGAGLPRISDGSFLFLQHMISKMQEVNGGSRIGIVFNGSPLFSGGAGSGESNIRKWIIENDMLEAIIAVPDQLFYNTGIFTYIWVLTNRKTAERKGKVQLINAVSERFYQKMSRSLGNKRNEIGDGENGKPDQIGEITRIYGDFRNNDTRRVVVNGNAEDVFVGKIFDNADFGYWRVTVERPLKLNFQADEERIGRLDDETAFANLAQSKRKGAAGREEMEAGRQLQADIRAMLQTLDSGKLYKNRDAFDTDLKAAIRGSGPKISPPLKNAIMKALSERDETADICKDGKGNPEPDIALRDYENAPLKQDISDYFEREVRPHVPDAWIDANKTVKGYEISFTRYFYKYKPLRSLAEIRANIPALEEETDGMIREVLNG